MTGSFQLLWGSTVLGEDELRQLQPLLTASEKERAAHLTESLSQKYLAGRFLSRKLGAHMLATDLDSVAPRANCKECGMDHGAIAIRESDLNISLSASGTRIVAAGIQGARIGVDIEQGLLLESREIATRAGVHNVTLAQWCEYEAVVKAAGVGMAVGFDEINFTTSGENVTAHIPGDTTSYMVAPSTQHEEVVLSVAVGS